MFIVTNADSYGNCTPGVFINREDALEYLYKCTSEFLDLGDSIGIIPEGLSDKEICEWCKNNVEQIDKVTDFKMDDDETKVFYSNGGFYITEIFEVKLEI